MARTGAKGTNKGSSSDDTKARIIAAARESLRMDGMMGASARAIARRGDFNQALIFYHFGSLNDLFIAALDQLSIERTDRYADRLAGVDSLADIVGIAGELHLEELEDGHIAILAQLLASVATEPDLKAPLRERFQPWADTVEAALVEALGDSPYVAVVPTADLAYLIVSVFIGLELMLGLEDDAAGRDKQLFTTLTALARILEAMLSMMPKPPTP
ncbi:TetR/AcrR family transcriptional regulator [Actinospongicola halichondriae]|uniref:TetR/AcrR family transcriptional regulator n=1 Tax=Actinospongicola halichondriae TaxID=3236844 RepID=UPI003D521234